MNLRELRDHADELGFTPQEQVRWLSPRELARTAVKVVLAATFADYADKREIQGALPADLLHAPLRDPDAAELWIDYVADLGDGYDATMSVATTLAAEKVVVEDSAGVEHGLSRGSLLILGGDEVYPVASATAYEDRMKGPYRAALPTADDRPLMVALPGNHDWYDGLTAFLRIFAQQRPIGGWQTRQCRSYFAVRLPQRWWLVGLDSQLGSYFDDPQLRYFETHLSRHLQPGDGVIVCSAEPTWLDSADKDVDAFNSLHWFDRNIVRTRVDPDTGSRVQTGASIRVWLTGDKHHYVRYAERLPDDPPVAPDEDLPPDPRRRQLVTCGLGGAYLSSTHRLPPELPLPPRDARMRDKDDPPVAFAKAQETYPGVRQSKRLARGIANPFSEHWLPRRNHGFAELAAGVHAFLLLPAMWLFALTYHIRQPVDAIRLLGVRTVAEFVGFGLVAIAALLALGWADRLLRKGKPGMPSSFATAFLSQVLVALVVLATAVALPFPVESPGWIVLGVSLAVAGALGATLGGEVFALWILASRSGTVADWQMSGQSIEDHKGFLRLHIDPRGDLTIYPLVMPEICREWDLVDDPAGGKRPVPVSPPEVELIEEPIVVSRETGAP